MRQVFSLTKKKKDKLSTAFKNGKLLKKLSHKITKFYKIIKTKTVSIFNRYRHDHYSTVIPIIRTNRKEMECQNVISLLIIAVIWSQFPRPLTFSLSIRMGKLK